VRIGQGWVGYMVGWGVVRMGGLVDEAGICMVWSVEGLVSKQMNLEMTLKVGN
jgi:hypothetical protein